MNLAPDAEALGQISGIVARHRGRDATQLAVLGMLGASGLSVSQMARVLPQFMGKIIPLDTVGLFWRSADGALANAYADEPDALSSELLKLLQWHNQMVPQAEDAAPPDSPPRPYAEPTGADDDAHLLANNRVMDISIAPAHSRINYTVVHDGVAPLGCIAWVRDNQERQFSAREMDLATEVAQLLQPAFAALPLEQQSTRRLDAGLIIVDARDSIKFGNRAAHQSLWMLASRGAEGYAETHGQGMQQLLRHSCLPDLAQSRALGSHMRTVSSHWGDFKLHYDPMEDGDVAISFVQNVPFACHLAERLFHTNLPARRVMACWLMVCGLPRKGIAERLRLSEDTVNEYVTQIYDTLNVRSQSALISLFSA